MQQPHLIDQNQNWHGNAAPPVFSTLVDIARHRARAKGSDTAYIFLGDGEVEEATLTYVELDQKARVIAVELQALEAEGQRVLLLYPPGLEFIAGFLGCLYAGSVAVPVNPSGYARTVGMLEALLVDARPHVALTTATVSARLERLMASCSAWKSLRHVITEDLSSSRADQWREKAVHQEQLALLQYTSGSTAAAKGVMVTHRNLMENERVIQQVFGQSEESLVVSWLPFFHDMGLIGGILQPLFVGARCVLMPPAAFLKRPANWLEAISRYRATTSGGPNFGYQFCLQKVTPEQRRRLDLSSWRVAFNGSEPVRHETLQRFAEQFAESGFRREAFHPCYGLAEATLLVAGQQRANGPVLRQFSRVSMNGREVMQPEVDEIQGVTLAGSGAVPEGHTVLIVDPESLAPQLEGAVGEICVRGPSVARGYWNQPAETGRVFDAHISGLDGAFLRTGDLGFFHDGELFVTGRLKDLIIIRGVNYHPHDIERIAEESHPCVRALNGAAFSAEIAGEERLVILQETVTAGQEETAAAIQSIREAVGMAFELQPYAVVLVRARTLLRTTSGKIRRSACRRAFLDNDLQVVRVWQEDATVASEQQAPAFDTQEGAQAWLVARIASRLGVAADALRLDIPLAACGVDSLGVMELMHDVEGLGASIPMLSLLECSGIADLAHRVFTSWRARSAPNPPPAVRAERAPMQATSHGQKSLWLAQQIAPQSAAYNLSVAARICSPLDIGALRRALEALSRRHDGLRSTFPAANGQPFQQIHEALAIPFEEHAFSQSTADANDEELRCALSRRASLPFRLDRDPAWRVDLYRSSGRAAVILLTAHHIIADFRSLEVCLRDIAILYAAELQGGSEMLPTPAVHYGDFVRWQEGVLASQKGEELWSYWQNQLSGDMPSLDLPTDHPRQAAQTYAGASEGLRLGGDLTARLRALARSQGCTLYTVLLGGLQALLCRYTSQDEFVVGTPALGRPQEAFQDVLGYFVNAVALRLRSAGHATFEEILGRARTVIWGAFQHQDYPFSLLVERLRPVREPGRNPIFQVMFTHLATRGSDADVAAFALSEPSARLSMGGLDLEPLAVENQESPFDLSLMTGESGQDVIARLQYNSALFDSPTMASMLGHWKAMLNSAVSEPQRTIFDLTILTPSEHQELLGLSTSTQVEYPAGSCIHELFEAQVNRTPARIAVTAADARLTYRELSCRADHLAGYLRSLGAGPDIPVGVCLERSIDIVVALLAVLKAGAAYVPIDPAYPMERLAFMVEDARIPLVVTRSSFHALFQPSEVRLVSLDTDAQRIETSVAEPVMSAAGPDNLAYIIYTSGSTGLPKGVMIAHRNVVNLFSGMDCRLGSESGTFLAVTSISFDISVVELLWTLCRGFEVMVQRPSEAAAGRRSSRRRSAESTAPTREVTHLQCTPSRARMLLAAPDIAEMLRSLRKLILGGEELPLPVLEALQRVTNAEIHNMYGPTETTVYSSAELTGCESGAVSIGRPIANTWIVVLDQSLRLAPRGVVGEICIGGDGLARGYLGRTELTAEKFIPDAITGRSGERLYRTGDLGRFNRSGKVEFLGRKDRQVKIRGYRVEPGEIEVALAQHQSVRESAVIAQSDASSGQRLVCFAVAAPEHPIAAADLRHFLSGRLPDYMIPSTFILLDKLPSTPNGKLDRGALSAMRVNETASGAGYVSPRTALEQIVAGIWAELLRLERVGLGENFFEIGGHSLLAVQVTSRLRELFHVEASLGGFLANPTVEGLCACISLEGGDELERMAEVLKSVIELSEEEVEAMLTQESIAMSSQAVVSR